MTIQFYLTKYTSMTWYDVDTMPLYELFAYNRILEKDLNPDSGTPIF